MPYVTSPVRREVDFLSITTMVAAPVARAAESVSGGCYVEGAILALEASVMILNCCTRRLTIWTTISPERAGWIVVPIPWTFGLL